MEHPFDEKSNFDTIFLSTRITQTEHNMLSEIQGWLQTTNQTATIRKQETVRRTIRMAYEYLQTQIAELDKNLSEPSIQVVDINQAKPKQSQDTLDMKAYYEMSNKSFRETRTQIISRVSSEKKEIFQKNLGL